MIATSALATPIRWGQTTSPLRLTPRFIEKCWGRIGFGDWGPELPPGGAPVGEIIHEAGDGAPSELLIKTLFTSDRLSVQVHPTGDAARALGFKHGKDEAWVVLSAEAGATIGLGVKAPMTAAALRRAVADGSIEACLDWRTVGAGDVLFAPAGTIHAIGAGITMFEIQQNLDLTYRLYDYGRTRPLHVDAALAVAECAPLGVSCQPRALGPGRASLIEGPNFVLERVELNVDAVLDPPQGRRVWVAVASGSGQIGQETFGCGDVWRVDEAVPLRGAASLILAYPGAGIAPGVWDTVPA